MTQLYEYCNTAVGGTHKAEVHADDWYAESFVAQSSHKMSQIKLLLSKREVGGTLGTVTFALKAADLVTGFPTGADLTSLSYSGAALALPETEDAASAVWKTIPLSYKLLSGTAYSIVIHETADISVYLNWFYATCPGGLTSVGCSSNNGGVTWAYGDDVMFELWGVPVGARHHPTIPTEPNRGKVLSRMGSL